MQSFVPVQHFGLEGNVLCLDILTFSLVSLRVGKPAYFSFAKLTFVHDLCVEKLWQQLLEGMQNFVPVQHFGLEDNILCLDFFLSQLEDWKTGLCFIR